MRYLFAAASLTLLATPAIAEEGRYRLLGVDSESAMLVDMTSLRKAPPKVTAWIVTLVNKAGTHQLWKQNEEIDCTRRTSRQVYVVLTVNDGDPKTATSTDSGTPIIPGSRMEVAANYLCDGTLLPIGQGIGLWKESELSDLWTVFSKPSK